MKKRMKKVLILNVIACLFLFHMANVFSYEYVDKNNKTPVELKKQEIYHLRDMYRLFVGEDETSQILNYGGICSMVTVTGDDAGTYSIDEYIAGVVKAEIGSEKDKPELLKAQAIAARSYLIATKKSSGDCTVTNGQSYQAFSKVNPNSSSDSPFLEAAQTTSGMVVMRNGEVALTQYISYPNAVFTTETSDSWVIQFQKFSNDPSTKWTWVGPSKNEVLEANNYASRSGAPSTSHHFGMSQTIAGWMAKNGKNYKEILETFYGTPDFSIGTLADGDYVGNIEYVDATYGNIRYWNQLDYGNYYYSHNVSVPQYKRSGGGWATISSHGCGPTSLAIVLSSFEGRDITPITLTQQVCQAGGCTSNGSYFTTLRKVAQSYGYRAEFVKKNENLSRVTTSLASGNSLVIALMGPGTFTKGGHYIVLTGTRSDGYVSVADPASRNRTNQKWFSFNLIVEQVKSSGFLIITK